MTGDNETWRPVVGFKNAYVVSSTGRVRGLDWLIEKPCRWGGHLLAFRQRGVEIHPYTTKSRQQQVVLHDAQHRRHCRFIDHLVVEAFGREMAT